MDVLIVEPLDPEVLDWLSARHSLRYAPELADDPTRLRLAMHGARALMIPSSVALDSFSIQSSPMLRAVGRLSSGAENIDIEACMRAGIEVVRPQDATAAAEAEFVVGALLQLLRRVPVVSADGLLVGRELGAATIGLLGITATARPLSRLLHAFGSHVVGYDPALHAKDNAWSRADVEPIGLRELFAQCDGVCVMLTYFTRYRGLLGDRYLEGCKNNQVLVSVAHSSLFDESALASALAGGRLAAAWFDSMEPGMLDPGRPLHHSEMLQVTPRVAGTTRESRLRSAWNVARRIDEILSAAARQAAATAAEALKPASGDLADLAGGADSG
jgi:D-3-phosphoglycerate dehydrogenase / 2-oxoglutarate reductase